LVKVRTDVENDVLLEVIVDENQVSIEAVLQEIPPERNEHPEQQFPVARGIRDDVVDDNLGDFRGYGDREGRQCGTKKLPRSETGVDSEVGENAED